MGKLIREYSLADLVADPLIGLMMRSDGVERGTIERLFERLARVRAGDCLARGSHLDTAEVLQCTRC